MKILIASKDLSARGGVASYYRLFFDRFSASDIELQHFMLGSRMKDYDRRNDRKLGYLRDLLLDLWRLHRILRKEKKDNIVQLSPSLIPLPLLRDALFMAVAKLHRKKVLIFFRGWREEMVSKIDASFLLRKIFSCFYCHMPDCCCVLARRFGEPLLRWGLPIEKLEVSYTGYDGRLIPELPIHREGNIPIFLFISRISESKGIDELLVAVAKLKCLGYKFHVDVYGHAAKLEYRDKCIQQINANHLEDVITFHDYIDGEQKYKVMANADLFLLPSWYEGCPNALVEALGVGLTVIATDVGAIPELVRDGENGWLIPKQSPDDLCKIMGVAIDQIDLIRDKRDKIREDAFKRLEIGVFIRQFEEIYRRMGKDDTLS